MTKRKNDKRRIEIEDKRARNDRVGEPEPEAGNGGSPSSLVTEEQAREPAPAEPAAAQAELTPEQQGAQYLELAQRREAEFRNYRRRVQKDIEDARRFAVEGLLADLFPALDGLAQAAANFQDTADGDNPLLDGLRRTVKALEAALTKHGIEKINSAPVAFDSELHQVLSVEEGDTVEEPTVVEVYVEGYRLGETVLKPAMVRVVRPAGDG